FTNQEVADMLGIRIDTVKDYLKTIFTRLEVSTRAEAVSLAVSLGIIRP
ncbi:MAG: response regulator transcription factor, partial [bacterium]|nr:response regulator transcription factor [Candidatus Colisoma equi]